jgi:hypothetical protein
MIGAVIQAAVWLAFPSVLGHFRRRCDGIASGDALDRLMFGSNASRHFFEGFSGALPE